MKEMKDKSKQALLIARAKRTALGRFLCRLAGDNAGAVMMEYVVLGVLVVAAVVGLVVAFGGTIGGAFKTMITAITNPKNTGTEAQSMQTTGSTGVSTGDTTLKQVQNSGQ